MLHVCIMTSSCGCRGVDGESKGRKCWFHEVCLGNLEAASLSHSHIRGSGRILHRSNYGNINVEKKLKRKAKKAEKLKATAEDFHGNGRVSNQILDWSGWNKSTLAVYEATCDNM